MSDQHPQHGDPLLPPPPPGALAPAPPSTKPRRPLTTVVLTAMAGVLVVAAAGFAVITLTEGDGADSAEEAVQDLFDAVDRQDAIGVAESLEPTERRILVDTLQDTAKEAKRVDVADDRLDLHAVDGVDLKVQNVRMHATSLDDDTVAVDIDAGHISSRAQLSKMPIGAVVQEVIDRDADDGGRPDDEATDEIELTGTRIVAVKRGGSWYVSALYSLAEQIRLDLDPAPAYPSGSAIPAVGADSPEAAVREGIAAATSADVRRLIELTPADEGRVLHTYGSILVEEAKGRDAGVTVDDLELKVSDAPGGRKRVSADSMTMTIETSYDRTTTTYDGRCSTTTYEYTDEDIGYRSDGPDTWKQCDDDLTALSPFVFFTLFYAPGSLDVIVEQHDGKWFLSPSATLVQNTLGTVQGLDVDQVRRLARAWGGEYWLYQPAELWEACGVAQPTLDDSVADATAAYNECMDSLPDDYDGPWGPWGGAGTIRYDDEGSMTYPGDECYDSTSSDDIEACLAGLVDAGTLDESALTNFRCGRVYDDVAYGDGLTDEQYDDLYQQADDAYEACIREAEGGGGAEGSGTSGGGSSPGSSGGGTSFGGGSDPGTPTTPNGTPSTTQPRTTTTTAPTATTTITP